MNDHDFKDLLEEAISYKSPKDRENTSETFRVRKAVNNDFTVANIQFNFYRSFSSMWRERKMSFLQ